MATERTFARNPADVAAGIDASRIAMTSEAQRTATSQEIKEYQRTGKSPAMERALKATRKEKVRKAEQAAKQEAKKKKEAELAAQKKKPVDKSKLKSRLEKAGLVGTPYDKVAGQSKMSKREALQAVGKKQREQYKYQEGEGAWGYKKRQARQTWQPVADFPKDYPGRTKAAVVVTAGKTGFIGTAAQSAIKGYATVEATKATGELTATKEQKEIMADPKFQQVMGTAFAGEQQSFASSPKYVQYAQEIPGVPLLFGGKDQFKESAREEFIKAGYRGDELALAVETAARQRTFSLSGEVFGVLGANIQSEKIGQKLVATSFAKGGTITGQAGLQTGLKAGKQIAKAGVIEGTTVSVVQQTARYEDPNVTNVLGAGAFGGVSAGVIGGTIVGLKPKSPGASKLVETAAFISDPYEKAGDIGAGFSTRVGSKIGKTPVVTPTLSFGTTPTGSTTATFGTTSKTVTQTREVFGITPTQTKTTTRTTLPVQPRSNVPISIITPVTTPTETPTKTPTPTPTQPPVTPVIPTQIKSPIGTPTETPTKTKTAINIPVTVPYAHIPPFTPFMQFGGRKTKGRRRKRPFGYMPSFDALLLGRTGAKRTEAAFGGFFTGQQTRVVVKKKTKRKKTVKRKAVKRKAVKRKAVKRKTVKRKVVRKKVKRKRKNPFMFTRDKLSRFSL